MSRCSGSSRPPPPPQSTQAMLGVRHPVSPHRRDKLRVRRRRREGVVCELGKQATGAGQGGGSEPSCAGGTSVAGLLGQVALDLARVQLRHEAIPGCLVGAAQQREHFPVGARRPGLPTRRPSGTGQPRSGWARLPAGGGWGWGGGKHGRSHCRSACVCAGGSSAMFPLVVHLRGLAEAPPCDVARQELVKA